MIYKKINTSGKGRLLFVGDTHGRYDILERALNKLGFSQEDTLVSVGDLVDRGPLIRECLDFFIDNDNCHFVIGNHEELMINRNNDINILETWEANGGLETQKQLGDLVDSYCSKICEKAPTILEIEHNDNRFGIIHAGIPIRPAVTDWKDVIKMATLSEEYTEMLVWDRDAIQAASNNSDRILPISGIDYVIHGHTPIYQPILCHNRIWIDTLYAQDALTFITYTEDGWKYYTFQ